MKPSLGASTARSHVLTPLSRVSTREGNHQLGDFLSELQTWLHDDLASLEADLDALHQHSLSSTKTNLAEKAAAHLIAVPGKRIRPVCVILSSKMGGKADLCEVRDLAVASELVHAGTLLHDDVIDEGEERRGAKCARVIYGNSASILAGDYLLIEALQRVRRTGRHELLDGLLEVVSEMVVAEALQLERRGCFDIDRQSYLEVINGKTAALFRWALTAGGALGGLSLEEQAVLARAGTALGLAFQLIDDVLDIEGDELVTGKTVLADIREGKLTWPLIIAAEQKPEILDLLRALASSRPSTSSEAIRSIGASITDTDAIATTRAFAKEQAALAQRELACLPDNPARGALMLITEAVVERQR